MRSSFLVALATLFAVAVPPALASTPPSSTLSTVTPSSTWTGGPFVASDPVSGDCVAGTPTCDTHALTIAPTGGSYTVDVKLTPFLPTDDYDLYVYDPNGVQVGSGGAPPGFVERVTLDSPAAGTYTVKVKAWFVAPASTYTVTATMSGGSRPGIAGTTHWVWNREAPQASVDVPLRVVLVGFKPGELDEAKLLSEIPTAQRPGVLIPRGSAASPDSPAFPFGATTLVNHGRAYYDNSKPFLVPYEYKWKPSVHYAPDGFTNGLFASMRANSTTGEFANSRNRQFLEQYNAVRGVYRGSGNTVAANAPVRFVDGEKTEDWIAANVRTYFGWDMPTRGKGAGTNPGYTVFIVNSWDSPQAKQHLKPEREYHVWKVNRFDPDTRAFDGIDWARIWGGRYRFMLVDTGAAPNPYEAETWGNRNRTTWGSANYDPPLWEYRAKAPRPVTVVDLSDGDKSWEQAVTPGATWDANQLNTMLARSVNQAASFRFLHSYLYEPHPQTGRYWFSDNVWHDAKAELPWASDLSRLYDQDVVLAGLRTLTPYLEFSGDVDFRYLGLTSPDQAMLDQAKQDGDDVVGDTVGGRQGAPHTAMRTVTAMDYIDANAHTYRGGPCYTTVPAINVVAEKHYAWAMAIAAGIATNRDGVPWGYLGSVNDVFKTPSADRDETMRLAHPETGSGAFTYTSIHEASHFLGLAHPHDSIGAVRRADGTARYYDGFTWAYNSTAAPTTYSHTELVYSILDQENIARGHTAYYLKWADEALEDGGHAFYDDGATTVDLLPSAARKLRDRAVSYMQKAEYLFSRFEFVNATFAAQTAFRAAAAYRDLALGLVPGTTEVEKGTQKQGASACGSAKESEKAHNHSH